MGYHFEWYYSYYFLEFIWVEKEFIKPNIVKRHKYVKYALVELFKIWNILKIVAKCLFY